jgi:hypothetical protein
MTKCVVCHSDLTDPKNRGDPDVNGDWVCSDGTCRAVHDVEMTCDVRVIYPSSSAPSRTDMENDQ